MKLLYVLILALTLPLTATASSEKLECLAELTNNFEVNSRSFTLNTDDYQLRNYGNDYLAFSIVMIRILLSKEGCDKKVVNFGKGPFGRSRHNCRPMVSNRPFSNVCYVETNLGAFVITTDFETLAHIIFKSWD